MSHLLFKYRLYPSKTQIGILEEQLELCRQAHNWLLESCKETYKETGKTLSQFDLNKSLICLKTQRPEIAKVHSQVLQNISKRIKDGYTNFFARRRAGLKAGLPRFKKYGTYRSITYPQSGFNVKAKKLYLSKIGEIRIRQHRELRGEVKTLTVKRMPSGRWYACFSCIVEPHHKDKPLKDVGIDVGLNSYAVLSDGTRIGNPRFYRKSEKRLAHLQRNLSRKKRGSNNRNKARVKVARLHEYIRNQRNDFLHKASRRIADTYGTVYVEDLKIRYMVRNHCLAKSISDAGWGTFVNMISYKAESAGGRLIQVNPRNTTQNCSQCGDYVKKTLSDRVHECPSCGLVMDRDLNASMNVLKIGQGLPHECPSCGLVMDRDLNASMNVLKIGQGLPESKPVEDKTTTPPTVAVQVYPVNQEASLLVGR